MSMMRCLLPYAAMIIVQFAYAGLNVLTKLALEDGLNYMVFIIYRHIISMFLLGLLSFLLERKQLSSLSWSITGKIFLLALFGVTIQQNLYYAGLEYASATVACALGNVIPALTFALAVILRMEKLKIGSPKGKAKIIGTLTCVSGALTFTFWNGGYLFPGLVNRAIINVGHGDEELTDHANQHWLRGSSLILASFVAYSAWLLLQAKVCEIYHENLSMNTLTCFFAILQSSLLALFLDRNPSSWRLEWNIQLLTIIYSGILISGLVYYLQTWCIGEKGPVFAAIFFPLTLVIVAIFSAIFLAERLHLGSLVGAILILCGLYCVLWGKSEAQEERRQEEEEEGKGKECITPTEMGKKPEYTSTSNGMLTKPSTSV